MSNLMVVLSGKTYPVRDELQELGAVWDTKDRCWKITPGLSKRAQALINDYEAEYRAYQKQRKEEEKNQNPAELIDLVSIWLHYIHKRITKAGGWYEKGEQKVEFHRKKLQRLGCDPLWIHESLAFLVEEFSKIPKQQRRDQAQPSETLLKRITRHKYAPVPHFFALARPEGPDFEQA